MGANESQRKPNLAKKEHAPTIRNKDNLKYLLPEHYCGLVHFPGGRCLFFAVHVGSLDYFN